jgi:hypothetical protein
VFDAAVREAITRSNQIRTAIAEDALFARIVSRRASPAETIFFLVNRSEGRWRHVPTIRHTGPQGGPLLVTLSGEERARRLAQHLEHRTGESPP